MTRQKIIILTALITWIVLIGTILKSTIDPLYQGYVCMGGTMIIFGLATVVTRWIVKGERE